METLTKWLDFRGERAKEIRKYEILRKTHISSLKTIDAKLALLRQLGK